MKVSVRALLVALLMCGHVGCSDDNGGDVNDGGNNSDGGNGNDSGNGDGPPTKLEEITITPKGGSFDLAGGLKVVVPAGAVDKDTTVKLRLMGKDELKPLYDHLGLNLDNVYWAMKGEPDGFTFKAPIKVTAPATVEPGDLPIAYYLDFAAKTRTRLLTTVMADPDKDLVETEIHHFSTTAPEKAKNKCKKGEDPCRCKQVKSKTKSSDYICGKADNKGECQVLDSKVDVEYPDCKPAQSHKEVHKEVNNHCVPKITLTPKRPRICTKDETEITATVDLGCPSAVLQGATVKFTVEGPASVSPSEAVTNKDGEATTKLTAQDKEDSVKVTATSDIEYYSFYSYLDVNGVLDDPDPRNKKEDKHLEKDETVEVKPGEWTGNFTFNRKLVTNCITDEGDYTGTFEFKEDCEKRWVAGTAKATQKASPKATGCGVSIQNIVAPGSFANLIVDGDFDDYLHMEIIKDFQYSPFCTFDVCVDGGCSPGPMGSGGILSFGYMTQDKTTIPLQDGTYSGQWHFNDGENWYGKYTITLKEKQATKP